MFRDIKRVKCVIMCISEFSTGLINLLRTVRDIKVFLTLQVLQLPPPSAHSPVQP